MRIHLLFVAIFCISTFLQAQDLKPKKDKETKKYGYINEKEEWVLKPEFDDADRFRGGFAKIYLSKKIGLVDSKGDVIVKPQYDDIDKFKENVATVKLNKLYGLINMEGKEILKPKYTDIGDFSAGFAVIKIYRECGLVKIDGTIVFEPQFEAMEVSGLTANVSKNGLWGMVRTDGTTVFPPQFLLKPVFNIKNSFAIVDRSNGNGASPTKGVISRSGEVKMDFAYNQIINSTGIFFAQNLNKLWVAFDENFRQVSEEFEEIIPNLYINSLYAVKKGGKWGFVNQSFQAAIPLKFDQIHSEGFKNDYCGVKVGDKWGFIKKDGSFLKEPAFDNINSGFISLEQYKIAVVVMGGKEFNFYDDGRLIENATTGPQNNATATTGVPAGGGSTMKILPYQGATSASTAVPAGGGQAASNLTGDNAWLGGKWIVYEEKIANVKTGNAVTYVYFDFISDISLTRGVRSDPMRPNSITEEKLPISIAGTVMTLGSQKYNLIPFPDKKSMIITGPLGVHWKLNLKTGDQAFQSLDWRSEISSNYFYIRVAASPIMYWDLPGSHPGTANNGIQFQIYPKDADVNERTFTFPAITGTDNFAIKNKAGFIVDIAGKENLSPTDMAQRKMGKKIVCKRDDGVPIQTWSIDGGVAPWQQWKFVILDDNVIAFQSVFNSKYIDIQGGAIDQSGAKLTCYPGNGTNAQKFVLEYANGPKKGQLLNIK